MIIAKGREIKEFSEIVNIEEQITQIRYTPQQTFNKEIIVMAFNADSGEELPNVLLRLRKNNSKISSEGLTKSQGEFSYMIDANCPHYLEVERKGFIPYFLEFNQTKGNEDSQIIKVPLFPIEKLSKQIIQNPESEEEIRVKPNLLRAILISDNENTNTLMSPSLHALATDPESTHDEEIVISKFNNHYENNNISVEFRDHENNGKYITLDTVGMEHSNKWFRLTAEFGSESLTDPEAFEFDQNFKNTLQDQNTKMLIFDDRKLVSIVYIPSYISHSSHWDIGFINISKGKFIKINSCANIPIAIKTFTRFYAKFFKYLNEEGKDFNIKHKLGFEGSSCILKGDDHVLTEEKDFIDAIKALPINWISENLTDDKSPHSGSEDESKLQMRKDELAEFFPNLANGFKNVFGEISLKKLVYNLEPHLGVSQVSPQKLSRTISKTSRRIYF